MSEKRRIFIGVPVGDNIPGLFLGFHNALTSSLWQSGWLPTHGISNAVPLDRARNNILNSFFEVSTQRKYDYLLWMDSDMMATPSHMSALLFYMENNPDADGVTALYFTKGYEEQGTMVYRPVCHDSFPQPGDPTKTFFKFKNTVPTEPTRVDGAGLGLMLLRATSLREKLMPTVKDGRYFWFDHNSEDLNFCDLMNKAGMKLMLLPDVVVPHLGGQIVREHFDRFSGGVKQ